MVHGIMSAQPARHDDGNAAQTRERRPDRLFTNGFFQHHGGKIQRDDRRNKAQTNGFGQGQFRERPEKTDRHHRDDDAAPKMNF